MTRRREPLEVRDPGRVGMYVCGPTVYGQLHIGNFRCFVVFDTVARFLTAEGYTVTRVQNFTDIDDRMIERAQREHTTVAALAERYIAHYHEEADALGILRAQVHPRATEHMDAIIRHIQGLVDSGHAYEVEGDVYFDVLSFPRYGALSGQRLDEIEAGARIEVDERKRHPADFALWKHWRPGEPSWPSPWGQGRPGWHIECSAMAETYLGMDFDIHAGGHDLIFPHHENEIAQSEAWHGGRFARYWLHNGMLTLKGAKMSRSEGNVMQVSSLRQRYAPQVLRLFLLSAHYRSPLVFSEELLQSAASAWARLDEAYGRLTVQGQAEEGAQALDRRLLEAARLAHENFYRAMRDDFNTADALAGVFDLAREINTSMGPGVGAAATRRLRGALREFAEVLGLEFTDPGELEPHFAAMIRQRELARGRRDWAEADRIRDELARAGVLLEDTAQGVRWRRA